jgi:radical SAM protein with 4Fe4S-binding SPASM domain
MGYEGFPLAIAWELTLACNLRCRHCGSAAGLPRADELTLKEALAICEQLPALLVREVDFTGGEPLVRSDWPQIAARLAELGIKSQIITNGLLMSAEVVAQMQDVGIAAVGFSVDGLEATHDHIRAHPGLFRRVLAGIAQTAAAGIPVAVITTVNALNVGELPALFELLRAAGVGRWQLQPLFPLGRGQEAADLRFSEQGYQKLGAFVQEWTPKTAGDGFKIELGDSYGYFTAYDTRTLPWRGCPAGLAALGITSDGKIKGCLSLPDEIVEGDLRQRELWDIWFDPRSFAYTRGFSLEALGPNCLSCDGAEICRGGCSAMSYGSTGRFHNDPCCFYGIAKRSLAPMPALRVG